MPDRMPVPESLSTQAEVPGIALARTWGDEAPRYWRNWMNAPDDELEHRFAGVMGRPHHYIALSGGGPFGAFGAGIMCGWTEKGDRPEFTIVTGISAGGLAAPFVFLGSDYDDELREIFTSYSTKDLIRPRNIFSLLWSDAAADSRPLRKLIATYLDDAALRAIAAEHRKGRRLFIGTTNLDAERSVLWNIGEIADSAAPGALELVHSIMLATASIPGAFPPVMIPVEADEQSFDEIHVDGGTTSTVFVYPTAMNWEEVKDRLDVPGRPALYLIQNFFVDPRWREIEPQIIPIASYAMYTLIRNQGIGDIHRVFALAQRDGLDFNLVHIPADFDEKPDEIFDPEFMQKLYDVGYGLGRNGVAWEKTPPGY